VKVIKAKSPGLPTIICAALAGWEEILGVELDTDYCAIAEARLAHWLRQPRLVP